MEKERLDIEINKRKFEELKEFINKHKKSRRSSKRFYGGQIAEMAYNWMKKQREEREMEAREFRKVEEKIREVLD